MRINNTYYADELWDTFTRFSAALTPAKSLPVFVGFLVFIDYDKRQNKGEFRKTFCVGDANSIVEKISKYGRELEEKNVVPCGFYRDYAFKNIDEFDSIYLCDNFQMIWNKYETFAARNIEKEMVNMLLSKYLNRAAKLENRYSEPDYLQALVCRLAEVKEGNTVYDPCAGLAGYAQCLMKADLDISFEGMEIDSSAYYLAHAVLIMGQFGGYNIKNDNSLLHPFVDNNALKLFDRVVSDLPCGVKLSDEEFNQLCNDHYGRFHYGVTGKANTEWMFIESALAAINDTGKAVLVTGSGPLFRSIEAKIRANILMEQDILEAVIQLPAGTMISDSAVPRSILIFNKDKRDELRRKVLSINAEKLGTAVNGRKKGVELSDAAIFKIVDAYKNPEDIQGFSKVFTVEEIAENDYSFNLAALEKSQISSAKLADFITLEDVAMNISRGVQVTPSQFEKMANESGDYHLLNLSNLENGKIIVSEKDRINPQKRWVNNYKVHDGDVLVSARGSFKCAIVEKDLPKSIASGNLIIIRLAGKYSPYVLKYYFESELGQELISQVQSGVMGSIINAAALAKIRIPNISPEKMQEYEEKICSYLREYEELLIAAEAYRKNAVDEIDRGLNLQRL